MQGGPDTFTVDTLLPLLEGIGFPRREYTNEEKRSCNPTLVVGLGTAGYQVVGRIKERMQSALGDARMMAHQSLVLATQPQHAYHPERPLPPNEYVYLPGFQAGKMVTDLTDSDPLSHWWPIPYQPNDSGEGTGGARALGRLVGHKYAGSFIAPRLGQRIDAMLAGARAFRVKAMPRLYLVCSVAGGTSGMLVDAAYILRAEMEKRYDGGYLFTGLLLMPSVFVGGAANAAERERMQANGYSALQELDIFNTGHGFKADFGSDYKLESGPHTRPFDVTYLVGRSNEQGLTLPTASAVYDLVSLGMALETAPPVEGNLIDALSASTLKKRATRKPAVYSSLGVGGLVFPLEGVAAWCSLKGQAPFTREVLLAPAYGQEQAEREAVALAEQTGMGEGSYEAIAGALSVDKRGRSLAPPPLDPAGFDKVHDADLMNVLRSEAVGRHAAADSARESVAAAGEALLQAKTSALKATVGRAAMDPERGMAYVQWLLSKLAIHLMRIRAGQASRHIHEAAKRKGISESKLRQADEAVVAALARPALRPGRTQAVKSAVKEYVVAANEWAASALGGAVSDNALHLYDRVLEEVNALQQWANQSFVELQTAADSASHAADKALSQFRLVQNRPGPVHSVLTDSLLTSIYGDIEQNTRTLDARRQAVSDFWRYVFNRDPEAARSWAPGAQGAIFPGGGPELIQQFLQERARSVLAQTSLLERLGATKGSQHWTNQEVKAQFGRTMPFWSLAGTARVRGWRDKGRQIDAAAYGEEPSSTSWPARVREATGQNMCAVRSLNTQELLFLRSAHDLPLSALREVEVDLKPAYRVLLSAWRAGKSTTPVHASREWEARIGKTAEE
jgi:hypothetical protein